MPATGHPPQNTSMRTSRQMLSLSKQIEIKRQMQFWVKMEFENGLSAAMQRLNHEDQHIYDMLKIIITARIFKKIERIFVDIISKTLHNIYFVEAKKFVSLVYTYDIDNIYKQWQMFNEESCRTAKNLTDMASEIFGSSVGALTYKWPPFLGNTMIVFDECMKQTNILNRYQMLVISNYIRNNSKNNNLYIPTCISSIIALYYEPMSLYCRIKQLFQHEIDIVLYQTNNIDQNLFEILNHLEELFKMIGKNFYKQCLKDIEKIFSRLSKECEDKYLSDEIEIMEYTNKVENVTQKCHDNYLLEKQCVNIFIPSYIQSILNKNNGTYNDLVQKLTKSQLKQIYNLFRKSSNTEAKRLNNAYKNRQI